MYFVKSSIRKWTLLLSYKGQEVVRKTDSGIFDESGNGHIADIKLRYLTLYLFDSLNPYDFIVQSKTSIITRIVVVLASVQNTLIP